MYDIIVPIVIADVAILKKNLKYIRRNLKGGRKVIAIASLEVKKALNVDEYPEIDFEDENSIFPGMNLENIGKILEERGCSKKRAGWYFQQFLKLAYAYKCQGEYYLSWDSDTVPIQIIEMFENGKPVFDMKTEYHLPYFDTIRKLFNDKVGKLLPRSFIAEHMLFCTEYVKAMINEIESNSALYGNAFWEKILWAIDEKAISFSGFSEFETYGSYVYKVYQDKYILREKESLRAGAWFLGYEWSDEMLKWAAKDYAIISFEKNTARHKWLFKIDNMIGNSVLRYFIRLKWVVWFYYKWNGLIRKCKRCFTN